MKLGLLLVASLVALAGGMMTVGPVPDCASPPQTFWFWPYPSVCRTGFQATEPALVYAIPLAAVLAVWLKKKLSRAKDAA